MPTCQNCGHSKSGQWFKGKICPNCEEPQEKNNIIEKTDLKKMETETIIEQKETNDLEDFFVEDNSKELYGEEYSSELPQEEIVEEKAKTTLDIETWEILTAEIYSTANEMLKDLNPDFYNSNKAKKLQETNAKLSAVILADKEVNPIVLLAFSNILYILPAIKGLFKKEEIKEKEEKEELQEDE
jgi:hypothetical protein